MSNFVQNSYYLRKVLLQYFILKKTGAESHRFLVKVYGEHALSETVGFDVSKVVISISATKTVENIAALQAFLDKDSTQTLKKLAKALGVNQGTISRRLHAIGKIQKEGKWVPYELKERDIKRRKTTREILFDRFKRQSFLHRIVTGDEKWIYFDNPKRKKSWVDPGQPLTSKPVCNIPGKKALLCISWDQKRAVYYELLKPARREKYSNVLQTHIVIVGQVRICRFSPNFDIA